LSNQESDFQEPEEELQTFEIPLWVKNTLTLLAVCVLAMCTVLICEFVQEPKLAASPKDLGIVPLVIFILTGLIIIWTPWKKLGIRISKVGGIEFEKIVAMQASEHVEEQSFLNERIDIIENHLLKNDSTLVFIDRAHEPELRDLLQKFLTNYSTWAFSPARIKAWGAEQSGFASFANFEPRLIRNTLQKMVAEGILVTRISKKGNTLYRIPAISN
jgi:hypothetical protein